ncbi:MAG: nitronate monooxygenase [Gaiellales bacterium]
MQLQEVPQIVCAPMAGAPSTVQLAAAVSDAGGLGFLGMGFQRAEAAAVQICELRACTDRPFGVNAFLVRSSGVDQRRLDTYVASIGPDAQRFGISVGEPRFDDGDFDAKIEMLIEEPVAVVSFTFGCPDARIVQALQRAGSLVWVTVTSPVDALTAVASGCDALVVQGAEAGGHRSSFVDDDEQLDAALDTITLLRHVSRMASMPLIGAGGIATADDTRAAIAAGATSIQAGTAFLLAHEAGTHPLHRAALGADTQTAFTRAFSGRAARGIVNAFMRDHADAPAAYPQIHHATTPIRAAAGDAGDPERMSLWAGTQHQLAQALPAAEIVQALRADPH